MTKFQPTAGSIAAWLGVLAAGLSLVLLAARFVDAISFSTPLQGATAGAETESLFVIWKFVNGEPIYADPYKIPFAATYYNWFYYVLYGSVSSVVLGLFSLTDAWLPTVARLTSLTISTIGAALFYRSFVELARPEKRHLKILGLASAVYVAFGPLIGFWAIAVHVELLAIVCQIAAIHLFCKHYRDRRVAALLWFCFWAYLSWASKQIYIYAPTSLGIFLILRRDWRFLFGMCAIMIGAWGLTIAVQDQIYLRMLFQIDTSIPMHVDRMLRNLGNVGAKTLSFTLGFAALILWLWISPGAFKRIWKQPFFPLLLIGTLVSAVIAIPASAKAGASENYYFPVVHFLGLTLLTGICWAERQPERPRFVFPAMSVGWLASAAAIVAVLSGLTGVISTRHWHRQFMSAKACLDQLPKPVFSAEDYVALPWMNPGPAHFVLAYHYHHDRARGLTFERDGIGGLIRDGYFNALMFKQETATFDGADLDDFRRLDLKCDRYVAYVRKSVRMPESKKFDQTR